MYEDTLYKAWEWSGSFSILGAYFASTYFGEDMPRLWGLLLNVYGSFTLVISSYYKSMWNVLFLQAVWFVVSFGGVVNVAIIS